MPTTTTGKATDFITFSRASLATVTDSDGRIKWAPHNLLTNSESFDASAWAKVTATVSANTGVSPVGTTTADKFIPDNGATGTLQVSASKTADAIRYTHAVFAKADGITSLTLSNRDDAVSGNNASVTVSLTDGSITTAAAAAGTFSNAIAVVTPMGSGWYLIALSFTSGTETAIRFRFLSGATGNGTNGILLWGAHLYRSDLGGMVANTSAYPMYNPTTPKNLLGFTEAFDNAAWTKTFTTVSSNSIVAPNGLQTADTLTDDTTNNIHRISQTAGSNTTPVTLSVYVKAGTSNYVQLVYTSGFGTNAFFTAIADLITGAITQSSAGASGTLIGSSITGVGNGWYRIAVTGSVASGTPTFQIAMVPAASGNSLNTGGNVQYVGTGASIYLWGAQLSDSASLDPYVPSYFAAPTAAAYHGPRLDYSASGSALGLLVEEQRTNLQIHSEAIDNVAWAKFGVTVAANNATAPSGSMTADTVTEDTSNGVHYISSGITLAANTSVAYSFYAKRSSGTRNLRVTLFTASSGLRALVNFDTLSVTNQSYGSSTYTSGTVTVVGNGWYRVAIVGIPSPTETNPAVDFVFHNGTGVSYTGDGTSGFQMWGFQAEAGAFATSYLPTGASTVSRSPDVASVATSAFPYSASASTLVANVTLLSVNTAGFKALATISDGTANNRIALYQAASATSAWQIVSSGGATQSNITPGSVSANTPFKLGTAVAPNDAAAYLNGSAGTPDNSVNMPAAATIMYIGGSAIGVEQLNGHIRQITYIPRRLSNAELQQRTA